MTDYERHRATGWMVVAMARLDVVDDLLLQRTNLSKFELRQTGEES